MQELEFNIICDNILNVIDSFQNEQFKLIITSPPYNIGKKYEKKTSLSSYLEWQESIITLLIPKLHKNGSIVWQVGNYVDKGEIFPLDIYFYSLFKKCGLQLRNRIIWHYEHGLHCSKRFSGRYETALWFTKSDEYTFNLDPIRIPSKYPGKLYYKGPKKGQPSGNPLGKNPSDVWIIKQIEEEFNVGIFNIPNVKFNHPEKTKHPCQFPVELVERFVLACTNEGDQVFDPFGGSGSSVIASVKHNRVGTMCEINEDYVKIAQDRVIAFQEGKLKTRELCKEVYQPTGKEKVSQIPVEWKR